MQLLFPNVYMCFCAAFSFAVTAVGGTHSKPGEVTDSAGK